MQSHAHARRLALSLIFCGLAIVGGCETPTRHIETHTSDSLTVKFSPDGGGKTVVEIAWEQQEAPTLLAVFIEAPFDETTPRRMYLGFPLEDGTSRPEPSQFDGISLVRSIGSTAGSDQFEVRNAQLMRWFSERGAEIHAMIVSEIEVITYEDWSVKGSKTFGARTIGPDDCDQHFTLLDTTLPRSRNAGIRAADTMIIESPARGYQEILVSNHPRKPPEIVVGLPF